MVDKDLEDFLKSPVVRKIAKKICKEDKGGHLNGDMLALAVFEDYGRKGEEYDRIQKHLGECDICRRLVEDERRINPIYQHYKEVVPGQMSEKEFWDYMGKIQEEVKKEIK